VTSKNYQKNIIKKIWVFYPDLLPVWLDVWLDVWFDPVLLKVVNEDKLSSELLLVSFSSSFAEPTSDFVLFPVVLLAAITPVPLERTTPTVIPIKNNILTSKIIF
jgi:hypothetical protein